MMLSFLDQGKRPLLRVLLGERNIPAVRASSRWAPRFAMKHQSQQALHFGFARHELKQDPREPDALLGQIAAALVGARHVVPTDAERGVNGFEHGVKALRQIALLRDFERNSSAADFCL